MKNSLQNQLIVWQSIAILLISIFASGISFRLASNEAQNFQDDGLRHIAQLVDNFKTPLDEEQLLELMDSDLKRIVVQPVITSPSSPSQLLNLPANLSTGYHTVKIDDSYWRVYVYATLLGEQIAVAQEATAQSAIARKSALLSILPFLVLIPILILVSRRMFIAEMSSLRTLAEIIDTQNEVRLSELPTVNLPDEIAPFIHAINRLLQRINLINESQRRFIADAAHELRSPLTALSLQAQNIERTGSFAISKERLVPLKDGLERSRHLINQLLDLVRQQASRASLVPVDMEKVALAVIEEMMPIAEARKIDLGLSREATVQIDADASAIQLMLRSAVENALRYSPLGGEVTVRIGCEDGDAVLEVIDNGPGIPEGDLERVFEAFYRLPNTRQIGSGLGLAIARSIADQFKGTISLKNRAGCTGLVFTYRQRQSQTNIKID